MLFLYLLPVVCYSHCSRKRGKKTVYKCIIIQQILNWTISCNYWLLSELCCCLWKGQAFSFVFFLCEEYQIIKHTVYWAVEITFPNLWASHWFCIFFSTIIWICWFLFLFFSSFFKSQLTILFFPESSTHVECYFPGRNNLNGCAFINTHMFPSPRTSRVSKTFLFCGARNKDKSHADLSSWPPTLFN